MLRNGLEPSHIILVVLVCLLLFGSKRLPDAARGLGKSMRILKAEARAMKNENNSAAKENDTGATAPEPPPAVTPAEVTPGQEHRTADAADASK
jgi:sec-independent protein translocase protein TatA